MGESGASVLEPVEGARSLRASEAAWLASVPCAAVVAFAIVVLGPSLGRMAFPESSVTFWASSERSLLPEPTEQARFLIALTAPILLAASIAAGFRRRLPLSTRGTALLVIAVQLGWLAALVGFLLAQRSIAFGTIYESDAVFHQQYFTPATFVVASLLATALLFAAGSSRVRPLLASRLTESRGRLIVAASLALVATAVWLLPGINTLDSIGSSEPNVAFHVQFTYDEALSVLNGRAPLADFPTQYGALWPYAIASAMAVTGSSVAAFTTLMCLISGISLMALFDLLRRVTQSAVAALLLFLPVLASSGFLLHGTSTNRYSFLNYFGVYPLRVAGPYLLAWIAVRHLSAKPRGPLASWTVLLAAWLVVLNNVDFGIPALGATVAALVLGSDGPWLETAKRILASAVVGLAAALALVSCVTLVHAGALPHIGLLFTYARLFAIDGYHLLPMPRFGFHLVVYLTFVAAIGVATARRVGREPDRALTGALAWSGVFGLGAGSYYVARSHPEVLVALFGPWALTLALLVVAAARGAATRASRWPGVPAVAVALGFGLAACSLAQMPMPWAQIDRIAEADPSDVVPQSPWFEGSRTAIRFVSTTTQPGEQVAILVSLGHAIAERAGVVDVAPYTGFYSMPTVQQFTEVVADLRRSGGRKLYLSTLSAWPEIAPELERLGFVEADAREEIGWAEYLDER